MALAGGVATYFISGRALKPLCEFSDRIEEVQAQNLSDSRIEESSVAELNRLSVSYNRMLTRLSGTFKTQQQFTANAAHEFRIPLAVMQLQLNLYNSTEHPTNDACAQQTICMMTEQNERLSKMVKADLEPLAQEKTIHLTAQCDAVTMTGSDILLYRLVYNLVENAIKYNTPGGTVTVGVAMQDKHIRLTVADTGTGIPEELKERVFEPFFRLDKSRSRALGGVGLGLALVREIVNVHGGSISVKDNPDGGTTFEVIF